MTRALSALRIDPNWKLHAALFVGGGTAFTFALAFIAAFPN